MDYHHNVFMFLCFLFLCFVATFRYQTLGKLPTQQGFTIHNLSNLFKQHITFTISQTPYMTLANGKRFDYNGIKSSKHQCWRSNIENLPCQAMLHINNIHNYIKLYF